MKVIAILAMAGIVAIAVFEQSASAGPYSTALANDSLINPDAPDAGIPGFVGPDGDGKCGTNHPNNYVNPIFKGWSTGYTVYDPFDLESIQDYMGGIFSHPEKTLGPVTGENFDIASLGDMTTEEITAWQNDPCRQSRPRLYRAFVRLLDCQWKRCGFRRV